VDLYQINDGIELWTLGGCGSGSFQGRKVNSGIPFQKGARLGITNSSFPPPRYSQIFQHLTRNTMTDASVTLAAPLVSPN